MAPQPSCFAKWSSSGLGLWAADSIFRHYKNKKVIWAGREDQGSRAVVCIQRPRGRCGGAKPGSRQQSGAGLAGE